MQRRCFIRRVLAGLGAILCSGTVRAQKPQPAGLAIGQVWANAEGHRRVVTGAYTDAHGRTIWTCDIMMTNGHSIYTNVPMDLSYWTYLGSIPEL